MPDSPVEWVELRVAWEIPAAEWTFSGLTTGGDQPPGLMEIWEYRTDPDGGEEMHPMQVTARLYHRENLHADSVIEGPCVVVETDATTYIPTGWVGRSTADGYLRIVKNEH
jgi:hypothetical protein